MNSFIPKKTNDGKKKIELHSSEIFDSKDRDYVSPTLMSTGS